ncbi:hypothetical protein GCM10007979_21650 [Nocardioides albus]|nr:hypothetical protein GCM10007979_21650 [Nocardioides albus]
MANLLAVLPLAFVMVAGPQFVSAVFLAASRDPRRASIAFLAGVALGTALSVGVFYLLAGLVHDPARAAEPDSGNSLLDYLLPVLLVAMAVRVFLRRGSSTPPAWMTSLAESTPRFAFRLGLLLFLFMPTDVLAAMTVGSYLARHDLPWWQCAPFVAVTVLLAAIPLLILVLMGKRADVLLPRIRAWMTTNSWVVSEIVIIFLLVVTLAG